MNQRVAGVEAAVELRMAEPRDVGRILDLIRHLAEYHDRTELVVTNEERLLEDGFGRDPQFECVVAESNGEIVGLAIFHGTYSTWRASRGLFIEELSVSPRVRGQGVGQKLVQRIAKIAQERGCRHLEMNVVHANPARNFYDRFGFVHVDDLLTYRLSGKRFERLAESA